MRRFEVDIPVDREGKFDVERQRAVAEKYVAAKAKHEDMRSLKQRFDDAFDRFAGAQEWA